MGKPSYEEVIRSELDTLRRMKDEEDLRMQSLIDRIDLLESIISQVKRS